MSQYPILCHFKRKECEIQAVGHADFVEDKNGNWWAVFLGIRLYGTSVHLHNIGRETFLMPVFWDKTGWPMIGERGYAEAEVDAELPAPCYEKSLDFHADFRKKDLDLQFFYTKNPYTEDYLLDSDNGKLLLIGHDITFETNEDSPTMISVIQPEFETEFKVEFDLSLTHAERAGISAYLCNDYHYDLYLSERNQKVCIGLAKSMHDIKAEYVCRLLEEEEADERAESASGIDRKNVTLIIRTDKQGYYFYVQFEGRESYVGFGANAGLSTEQTMKRNFTGVIFSAFCINGKACLYSFDVKVLKE